MIACQHGTWSTGIAGTCSRTPGRVPFHSTQPPGQVAHGAAHSSRSGRGVRLSQVKPAHARYAGNRLGPHLDEVILAGERYGTAEHGVLGVFGNGRRAALGGKSGLARMTAKHEPATDQEKATESPAVRSVARFAARDSGKPYAWIQVHANLRRC
jgi:hypothetical protein